MIHIIPLKQRTFSQKLPHGVDNYLFNKSLKLDIDPALH